MAASFVLSCVDFALIVLTYDGKCYLKSGMAHKMPVNIGANKKPSRIAGFEFKTVGRPCYARAAAGIGIAFSGNGAAPKVTLHAIACECSACKCE